MVLAETSAWISLAAGAIGGLLALGGVVISQIVASRQEKRRHDRRLESEVRVACGDLLVAIRHLKRQAGGADETWDAMRAALNQLHFLAPPTIANNAQELFYAFMATALAKDEDDDIVMSTNDEYNAAELAFVNEVRDWLGLPPLRRL